MKLILGSKSPRRQQLLRDMGYEFTVYSKETDESFPNTLESSEVSMYIARLKAADIWRDVNQPDTLLLTSDTVVAVDQTLLGKPTDFDDAKKMLQLISGRVHQVYTSICVWSQSLQLEQTVRTDVYFKPLSEEEIEHYINTYQPYDKAGSYGIQEWIGLIGVERIEGSYNSVVGLPTFEVHQLIEQQKRS